MGRHKLGHKLVEWIEMSDVGDVLVLSDEDKNFAQYSGYYFKMTFLPGTILVGAPCLFSQWVFSYDEITDQVSG